MSCYRQYKSEIKDLDVMERGLRAAGLVAQRNGTISTYGNRNQKVDLAVSEDAGKSFHFGFVKGANGNYDVAVEHDYLQRARVSGEAQFVERMHTIYSYQMTLDSLAAQDGLTVDEVVGLGEIYEKGGQITLTVDVADHLLR